MNHDIEFKNPLIIYANHADFQQNDIVSSVSIGTGGVTEGRQNRVVMPFAEANKSTNYVLRHELVHAFQYDIARKEKIGGVQATSKLPLWFVEGMAEYLSTGPESAQPAMYLRDAVFYDDIPSILCISISTAGNDRNVWLSDFTRLVSFHQDFSRLWVCEEARAEKPAAGSLI